MPYLGLTRVDGALYGFWAKCEAFWRRKFPDNSVAWCRARKAPPLPMPDPGEIGL